MNSFYSRHRSCREIKSAVEKCPLYRKIPWKSFKTEDDNKKNIRLYFQVPIFLITKKKHVWLDDLGLLGPNMCHNLFEISALLDVKHCSKLESCAISRKTNDTNLRKCQNPNFGTNFGLPKSFFVSVPLLVRNCFKLSFYAIWRKTNKANLRKW